MRSKLRFLVPLGAVILVAVGLGLALPGSPIYLPELLIRGGVHDGRPTSYWIEQLNHQDSAERIKAMQALATIGPENAGRAVPRLGEILTTDKDPHCRNEAALALSKMIPHAREVMSALIQAAEDEEIPVRANVMMTLFRLKTDAKPAIPVIIKALQDEKNATNAAIFAHTVQEIAALALGRATAGTTEGLPHLAEFLKKASTSMAKEAGVRAIGEVGPEARSLEELLLPFLKDRNKQVREATAETLTKLGLPVPDVGEIPPEPPPPGVNPQDPRRFPGGFRPGGPAGNAPPGSAPAGNAPPGNAPPGPPPGAGAGAGPVNQPRAGDAGGKDQPNPEKPKSEEIKPEKSDRDKKEPLALDPNHLELPEAERQYLWEIEHHGNVLVQHGFRPFAEALSRADAAALSALLAPDFRGGDLKNSRRVAADRWLQVERLEATTSDSLPLDRDDFVRRLLEWRQRFPESPPQVRLALMTLSPVVRGQLDGPWEGTAQLRLFGQASPGAPMEIVATLRYAIDRPTRERLSQPGWIHAMEPRQVLIGQAPGFLFRESASSRGFSIEPLFDNWKMDAFRPATGGVFVTDYDRDGHLDVLITDLNGLFLYRGIGAGRFEEVTAAIGLPRRSAAYPAAWVDIDGDGWDDLVVGRAVWRNDQGRRFVNYTSRCRLNLPADALGIVVADYNRDGRLDLYVTRGGHPGSGSWLDPFSDDPHGNYLLRNNGDWTLEDVTRSANASGGRRSTFSAAWLDANDDGWPDLHVINEFGDGILLVNRGDGTFQERPLADRPADFGSMGVAVGDVNNDGRIDIYCANMYSKAGTRVIGNMRPDTYPAEVMEKLRRFVAGSQLHLNRGELKFEQVGPAMQVAAVGWAYGPALADLDNDGWLDIYGTAGFISRDRNEPDG
ncbi:MAG: FG-GAP-like repeat-containing protein [Gemmataceae bacterium]|nr:FG-GAP-like repeat-containing protein [Gemmataceae bacterium]